MINKRGFTLIELIAVISILGLLMTLAATSITKTLNESKENLLQELKIMTRQIVNSHVDELTNSYMNGDYEVFESVVNTVFRDTDSLYADYTNKLLVYVERNFKEFNLFLNPMSNLVFDPYDVKQKGKDSFGESTEEYKM